MTWRRFRTRSIDLEGEQTKTMWIIWKRLTQVKIVKKKFTQLMKIRKTYRSRILLSSLEENDLQPARKTHDVPAQITR